MVRRRKPYVPEKLTREEKLTKLRTCLINMTNRRVLDRTKHTPAVNEGLVDEFLELNAKLINEVLDSLFDELGLNPYRVDELVWPKLVAHAKGRIKGPGMEPLY